MGLPFFFWTDMPWTVQFYMTPKDHLLRHCSGVRITLINLQSIFFFHSAHILLENKERNMKEKEKKKNNRCKSALLYLLFVV